MINLNLKAKVKGIYTLTKHKVSTGEIVESRKFNNLITDWGLNALGGSLNKFAAFFVGTGNTTPAFTDTTLAAYRAYVLVTASGTSSNSGSPDYFSSVVYTAQFGAGAASGNLTEIGIGYLASATGPSYSLFSRALIVDTLGNPVTLTILADEYLTVTYELQIYLPLTTFTGTFSLNQGAGPETINYSARVANVNSFLLNTATTRPLRPVGLTSGTGVLALYYANGTPALGPVTGQLTGVTQAIGSTSSTDIAYVSGSYSKSTRVDVGLESANPPTGVGLIGAITSVQTDGDGICLFRWQILWDTPIMKTNTKVAAFSFSITWGRKT